MDEINNMNLLNIFESSTSISEVLKKLNICDNSSNWRKIKILAIEVGFDIEIYKNNKKKFCLNCGKQLKHGQTKFCSKSCSATFNNKGRIVSDETKEKIRNKLVKPKKSKTKTKTKNTVIKQKPLVKHYCENCGTEIKNKYNKKFCSVQCIGKYQHKKSYEYFLNNPNNYNSGGYIPKQYRDFFMNEQNNKCAICGCEPIWNGKEIHFVIDHIDGDVSNNKRENIRMICPNCDSQTDTFKSRNKNSTRRNYWKEKIIRDIKKDM